mgnify:CR=1 FL=1
MKKACQKDCKIIKNVESSEKLKTKLDTFLEDEFFFVNKDFVNLKEDKLNNIYG